MMLKHGLRSHFGPALALLVIVALFAIADSLVGEGFFSTTRNVRVMISSASLIAVPALGMTLIIIAGGIDLSAGTALTLCGTTLAYLLKNSSVAATEPGFALVMLVALSTTMVVGCLCGFVNGTIISATGVVPFIVTLGTMTIFLGIGQLVADQSTVYAPKENIPSWLRYLCYTGSNGDYYPIAGIKVPANVLIASLLAVLVAGLMRYTIFGRNVYAIGSSSSTARLCGINVPVHLVSVYTLAGFFTAVGGLLYFADVKNGNPNDGTGKELEIIAAVVLGGGSLSGGRGSMLGTIFGALIITVIRSGCSQLSIPNTYSLIIIGAIIIVAVIIDQLRQGSPEWLFRWIARKESIL